MGSADLSLAFFDAVRQGMPGDLQYICIDERKLTVIQDLFSRHIDRFQESEFKSNPREFSVTAYSKSNPRSHLVLSCAGYGCVGKLNGEEVYSLGQWDSDGGYVEEATFSSEKGAINFVEKGGSPTLYNDILKRFENSSKSNDFKKKRFKGIDVEERYSPGSNTVTKVGGQNAKNNNNALYLLMGAGAAGAVGVAYKAYKALRKDSDKKTERNLSMPTTSSKTKS